MASPPTCKLCGKAHWANEPHAWQSAKVPPPPAASAPSRSDSKRIAELEAEVLALRAEIETLRGAGQGRRSYMRDYMRKYRSKER